ncbi:MAG: membrane dipeptidase [Chloroflexota bacterium]
MPTDPPTPQIVVDAHEDIAFNAVVYGRDFTKSAYTKRKLEGSVPQAHGIATTGLPESRLGRVGIIFGTLFVAPAWAADSFPGYETPQQAYTQALDQIDVYHRMAENDGKITLVRTQAELDSVLVTWAEGVGIEDHKVGIVISMEGADPIIEPKAFEEWYERGVRAVGLAWSETRYSGGTKRPGPLTAMGRDLLEVMESFNTILDLSHMADEAYFEAVERYGGPIIASHSNPRKFCDTDRQLSDDMIRRLAERDGVMGIVPYNNFLQNGWSITDKKVATKLDLVIGAIDHVCQVTGSANHVGIGSDFDGGFGAESIPAELDTVADLRLIGPALVARGYTPEAVTAILSGNFLRILRTALPK